MRGIVYTRGDSQQKVVDDGIYGSVGEFALMSQGSLEVKIYCIFQTQGEQLVVVFAASFPVFEVESV